MALAVFPSLPGIGWSVKKSPRFATRTQKAISGRELRIADQILPIWTFELTYEILRDKHDTRGPAGLGAGYDELRTLAGFFLQMQGSFQTFLFDDPTDDTVTGQLITTGDGTFATFQLVRTFGGFTETIPQLHALGQVYYNGTPQGGGNFSLGPVGNPGLLTDIRGVVPNAAVVTADFTYYFAVRFADDIAEFENFMYQLWALKTIKLQSVLL